MIRLLLALRRALRRPRPVRSYDWTRTTQPRTSDRPALGGTR